MLEESQAPAVTGGFTLDRFFNMTEVGAFQLFDLFAGLVLGTFMVMALVQTYRTTHRGATYSVAFLQSLFILAACTTLIMVVIGSNIARAFSLVGALSIIRFRTAIKDPRDVGFVFATLAIGMGCGTGFYAATILFTVFMCSLLLVLSRLNVGEVNSMEAMLRITVGPEGDAQAIESVEAALRSADASPVLVGRVTDQHSGERTLSWRVRTGADKTRGRLQETLSAIEGVTSVGVFAMDDFHVL